MIPSVGHVISSVGHAIPSAGHVIGFVVHVARCDDPVNAAVIVLARQTVVLVGRVIFLPRDISRILDQVSVDPDISFVVAFGDHVTLFVCYVVHPQFKELLVPRTAHCSWRQLPVPFYHRRPSRPIFSALALIGSHLLDGRGSSYI